jgi:hypothetical protein
MEAAMVDDGRNDHANTAGISVAIIEEEDNDSIIV